MLRKTRPGLAPGDFSPMRLIAELRRRNVFRMAGLYLVGAWLATQVAGTLLPMFEAPPWVARTIVIVLAAGFVPALVLAWAFELTPEGLARDDGGAHANPIAPKTARRLDRAIIAVLTCALAYFAVDKFMPRSGHDAPAPRVAAATPAKSASIAVLPLANDGGDKDQQYFADGLSEDLITALSRFGGLKVISRNSAFQFRDSHESSQIIGEKLGVAHLLEGSVRRLGDMVRIHASLVLASDGSTVWSERYDRPYVDLFKLQDDITNAVATALRAQLADAHGAPSDDHPPSGDLAAFDAYMRGRSFEEKRTEKDFKLAYQAYDDAVARDPRYAQAWAAYATAKVYDAGIFLGGKEAEAAVADARRFVDRALALAPDSAYVNLANSRVLSYGELRFVDAEIAAQRALALSRNAETTGELGLARSFLGDAKGAEALQREAVDYDPANGTAWFWLSVTLASEGRLDEARAAVDRAIASAPESGIGYAQRALIEILRGDYAKAVALAEATPESGWRRIALALATQKAGNAARADEALQDLVEKSADGSAYQIAEVYALRGEADQLFAWLDNAWTNRDPGIRRLLLDPFMAPYRGDARFAAFCRKVGLPLPLPV
jgi:TolB-like protein/tetratricopeptide (TPR) repeat protein